MYKSLCFLCIAALSLAGAAAARDTEEIVIEAGHVLDPEGGRSLEGQRIVIRDGLIVAVGATIAIPAGAKLIDLRAYTVLPGLIDVHTHLVEDLSNQDPVSELQATAAQRAYQALPNAKAVLLAGFTTVRDVGTYRALVDVALRDAINRGDVVGPRMYVVGAYLTVTGGGGAVTGYAPDVTLPWDLRYGIANSPDQFRERVRDLAGHGVDWIKVFATGAVLAQHSSPTSREMTRAELDAVVDEAHAFGLKVAAHAHSAEGIKNAIRAGVASIEHGIMMDDEGRALMKEHGTYLVPTLEVHQCIASDPGFTPEFIAKSQKIAALHFETFRKAVAAGVKIAFGTDIGVCAYGQNAREFALMVENGMTPLQAIRAATLSAADLLSMTGTLGSIRPGKIADIIAVRGDPLTNIKILEDVRFVMKQGVVYRSE